jgi:hypothetical protein
MLQGSNRAHTLTPMPYGGSLGGGQPPTWPPLWGLATGGSLMPWGPLQLVDIGPCRLNTGLHPDSRVQDNGWDNGRHN